MLYRTFLNISESKGTESIQFNQNPLENKKLVNIEIFPQCIPASNILSDRSSPQVLTDILQ